MKNDRITQGAFEQMSRERALEEIINERLTTSEKQNVYIKKKYNEEKLENQLKVNSFNSSLKREIKLRLERKQEYENRLIAIEEKERALTDKKIYLNECIETALSDIYILQEQITNISNSKERIFVYYH
jgi:hypothetical protein